MPDKIRVLVVDDHDIVRMGMRTMLLTEDDIEIIGEANNGVMAVELACELNPDVVVMDVQMPEMNGIEATREIKRQCPAIAVLALTIYEDEQYFQEMLGAGATGYVPKRAAPDDLVTAIRVVNQGHMFLYSSLMTAIAAEQAMRDTTPEEPAKNPLTPRETEVLTLIAEGLMNKDIAVKLTISVKTVERHRENIMNKLNLHSRTDLIKYAIRNGLVGLD